MERESTSVAAAESGPGTSSTLRLVIRVRILPEQAREASKRHGLSRGALALTLGAVAVLLGWIGISVLTTEPAPTPAAGERTSDAQTPPPMPVPEPNHAAPAVTDQPVPEPTTEAAATRSAEVEPRPTDTESADAQAGKQPDASPTPINEVIPDVPKSARDTIRGTIRVTVRVIVDKQGAVLGTIAENPGPSRYFERLAVNASKKWTFAPTDSEQQRVMLVSFNFTRAGTTARANAVQ